MSKHKIISLILCFTLLFTVQINFADVSQTNPSQIDTQFTVEEIGHGEYKLVNDVNGSLLKGANDIEKVKKLYENIYVLDNPESLKDKKDYDKLLKVNNDTFLRVKEIKIDLLKIDDVEDILSRYDVNEEAANNIRSLAKKAQDSKGEVSKELILYTPKMDQTLIQEELITPNMMQSASWTRSSDPYYYIGYNNYKYCDEVFYAHQATEMHPVKNGFETKQYISNVIYNIGEYYVSQYLAKTALEPGYSVAKIFFPSVDIAWYGANQSDFWEAGLVEQKWKKYTSIEVYDATLRRYIYICRAIGDHGYMNFSHRVYFQSLMIQPDYRTDPQKYFRSPNYYNLDRKAYERMFDIPYDESMRWWSPNEYTRFDSLN